MAYGHSRILFIDSYDSFTNNLVNLCHQSIPNCRIHIIKNDQLSISQILPYLKHFTAIIVGPGPGSPLNDSDIGVVKDLWNIDDEHLLPIFGVCLGLQSLAVAFGARLKRLNVVKHGQLSNIIPVSGDLFRDVGYSKAVRYHSLHVELEEGGVIEKLAYADDGEENGEVVMAIQHKSKPFWAVQYHPESVQTDDGGFTVLENFWMLAEEWLETSQKYQFPWNEEAEKLFGPCWPKIHEYPPLPKSISHPTGVSFSILELSNLHITSICEALGVHHDASPFVLLDSAAQPGRFSIIGCLTESSPVITHFVGDDFVTVSKDGSFSEERLGSLSIWSWLESFMRTRKAEGGPVEIPFWGGLVGYLSYELGLTSLVQSLHAEMEDRHPDANLAFVERSIVIDTECGKFYVQSILPDDNIWIEETCTLLTELAQSPITNPRRKVIAQDAQVIFPDKELYLSKINAAKDCLYAGESYEICLTAPTSITVPKLSSDASVSSSWERYKNLRQNNPAPHSAYIRLHPTTLLSSSPERFLAYTRPPSTVCQLRPIKGTVRKSPAITRAIAEEMLIGSVKEVAENLMIVDLIRHDLHGVLGEDVSVARFCEVEEYETVWQLVSVIEGALPGGVEEGLDVNVGWEVLRRSLPPGSMTGAPKKRSVEILQNLEDTKRGIYSGVHGYWCVGGSGDWSVTIRSCFKYEKHSTAEGGEELELNGMSDEQMQKGNDGLERWRIGAGGAITALSDPEAEWDEMLVKLQSVLRAFGAKYSVSEG